MSNLSSMLPWVPSQWLDRSGRPLSGGQIFTYQSGTSTPKQTYATSDQSVINTNPVILDAAGRAPIFPGTGAYRIEVQDRFGVQVDPPIDGIIGVPLSDGASESVDVANLLTVDTYADLRALTGTYSAVYVGGRTSVGDGGQGVFQRDPSEEHGDDNGISLVTSSGVYYRRNLAESIDPCWYGLVYQSATGQDVAFDAARTAAATYRLPLLIDDSVYLSASKLIGVNQYIICNPLGRFLSPYTIEITFQAGSYFSGQGLCFGAYVQPIFSRLSLSNSEIPLSWMGDPDPAAKLGKWVDGAPDGSVLLLDSDISISGDLIIPEGRTLVHRGGVISLTGSSVAISIPSFSFAPIDRVFDVSAATLSSVTMTGPVNPEWFGAVGDGSTPDTKALIAGFLNGSVFLQKEHYVLDAAYSKSGKVSIRGNLGTTLSCGGDLSIDSFALDNVTLYCGAAKDLQAQYLILRDSSITPLWTVGCAYLDAADSAMPLNTTTVSTRKTLANVENVSMLFPQHVYSDKPRIEETHLAGSTTIDNQVSGYAMTTDGQAKIVSSPRPIMRSCLETCPRGLLAAGESYISTPPAGGRLLIFAPIYVPVSCVFKTPDMMTIAMRYLNGNPATVSLGIAQRVGSDFVVQVATPGSDISPTTKFASQYIDSGVLFATLDPSNEYFAYVSVVSTAAAANMAFHAGGGSGGGADLPDFPYGTHYQSDASAIHPSVGESLAAATPSNTTGTPYIRLQPGDHL